MSETPLTDERTFYTSELSPYPPSKSERNSKFAVVYAAFAKGLERENARLRTELGLYVDADFARQLERENARLLYGLKFANQFLENATSYIGAINDHDMPKALYALDAVRFALSEINADKKP